MQSSVQFRSHAKYESLFLASIGFSEILRGRPVNFDKLLFFEPIYVSVKYRRIANNDMYKPMRFSPSFETWFIRNRLLAVTYCFGRLFSTVSVE
jgi:hypothetical protein